MKHLLAALFVMAIQQVPNYGNGQVVLPGMATPRERIQNGGNPWPRGTVGNPTYSLPQPGPGFHGGQVVPNQPLRPMGYQ